jgi:hypothetical protein
MEERNNLLKIELDKIIAGKIEKSWAKHFKKLAIRKFFISSVIWFLVGCMLIVAVIYININKLQLNNEYFSNSFSYVKFYYDIGVRISSNIFSAYLILFCLRNYWINANLDYVYAQKGDILDTINLLKDEMRVEDLQELNLLVAKQILNHVPTGFIKEDINDKVENESFVIGVINKLIELNKSRP